MPKGELSSEADEIASKIDLYKDYTDLPLVTTGCDSFAAWSPAFKHLSPMVETDGLVDSIVNLLPQKRWVDEHLVITGGEPLLGWQRSYPELLSNPKMTHLKEITFETNGTQELIPDLVNYLTSWKNNREKNALTFSVSPKLSVSGEKWESAIRPEIIRQYDSVGFVYLKFVVATEDDVAEAEKAVGEYRKYGFRGPVYLMPMGGTNETYQLNTRNVAELAMKKGWRYSPRLQCDLFKNAWNT